MRRRLPGDAGVVTAELALSLLSVVIVLAALLATTSAALNQVRVTDAAREAARAASRNEPAAVVAAVARAEGPPGTQVHLSHDGDRVVVTVAAPLRVHLIGRVTIPVPSRAVAVREPEGELVAVPLLLLVARRRRRRRRAPPRRAPEDGAGTVIGLGLVVAGVLLTLAVSLLGQAVVARHRAATAADLAALAAARVAWESPVGAASADPCDVGRQVALDNGGTVTRCQVDDGDTVAVSVQTELRSGAKVFRATADARAGPAQIAESNEKPRKVIDVTH